MNPLFAHIQTLPGVGEKKTQAFAKHKIKTIRDLLHIFPRTYERRLPAATISQIAPKLPTAVFGLIVRANLSGFGKTRRLEVIMRDQTDQLRLVFFHSGAAAYLKTLKAGQAITAIGQADIFGNQLQMAHPRVVFGDKRAESDGIWPIYPALEGFYANDLGKIVFHAVASLQKQNLPDPLPSDFLLSAKLLPMHEAYEKIHRPAKNLGDAELLALQENTHPAFRRLAFDEIFFLQLAFAHQQKQATREQAHPIAPLNARELFGRLTPFAPTAAQERVVGEIANDMSLPHPMARLLQGDVGAGKTAVAGCACLLAATSHFQSAVMAPTEILADQHYHTFRNWFEPLGFQIGLLKGSTSAKDRKALTKKLQAGEIQIVIGTHALLSDDVIFDNLALCVIDEQHRFGVDQREALKKKGRGKIPHLLVMTATPIPRSLALTAYGNLALSIIDEMPPGRKVVDTHVLRGNPNEILLRLCQKIIDHKEKAYIVYPLVAESEKLDLEDATSGCKLLQTQLGENQVRLVHGRMSALEKQTAIDDFMHGRTRILVATTVIEVGVNVPDATCMVVMHAERFGLSELHQLRGRVGRSELKSRCYLITDKINPSEDALRRLLVMEQTNDGFVIANEDLSIRGPGDFLGTRQAGLLPFNICDLVKHADLIEPARRLALECGGNFQGDLTISNH